MNDAKFIYKTLENNRIPSNSKVYYFVRTLVLIAVGVMIVSSFIFGFDFVLDCIKENSIMIFIILVGLWNIMPKKVNTPSLLELRFYDDYFVIYGKKRYYSRKLSRLEFNKFYYNDIDAIEYDWLNKRLVVRGKIDAMWFSYISENEVEKEPSYHRVVDEGICYFYVYGDDYEEVLDNIKKYTSVPIKITQKDETIG